MYETIKSLNKYETLNKEIRNIALNLIRENKDNEESVLKVLDYIETQQTIDIPHEIKLEGWDDNLINFTDGVLSLLITKEDDHYKTKIESCIFCNYYDNEEFTFPIPEKEHKHSNVFVAISQIMLLREDYMLKYYQPNDLLCIKNYSDLIENPDFNEWKEIVFSEKGLYGIDFTDIYEALENKECSLIKISSQNEINPSNFNDLPSDLSNVVFAIKLPKNKGNEEINKVAEMITEKLPEDCNILWQGVESEDDKTEIIVIYNKNN